MADNTFNFDLDAPAVPTLTLDPTVQTIHGSAPTMRSFLLSRKSR